MRDRLSIAFPGWLLLLLLGLAGCDRRVAPFVPTELEPPAPERPVRIPGIESPEPRDAPLLEAGGRAIPENAPSRAGDTDAALLRGTLRLARGAAPPAGGIVFVIARSGSGGPPLAVKRLALGSFPMEFELGPADAMIQGRPLAGPVLISARIDADGDPLTRDPRDLEGRLAGPVKPPADGLELVLEPGQS